MAYEKLELVNAFLSGEVYLARINKDGMMSDNRKVMTKEVLRAATEWFMSNKKKMIGYGELPDGSRPYLFHTTDKDKAERIIAILEEEDNQ